MLDDIKPNQTIKFQCDHCHMEWDITFPDYISTKREAIAYLVMEGWTIVLNHHTQKFNTVCGDCMFNQLEGRLVPFGEQFGHDS